MSSSKYDLNRFKKIYPLVRVKPFFQDFTGSGGIDAETTILEYDNSFEESYTFTQIYNQIPTVSATPEDENVNVFITSLSLFSVTIQSSSPFTGKVHIQIFKVKD